MKANGSCKHRGPESFHRQLGWGCSSWWWSSLAEWLRVMTKPLFDFRAKEGSKPDVFHDVVTISKPFSCPAMKPPLLVVGYSLSSFLFTNRWLRNHFWSKGGDEFNIKAKAPCWLHREIFTLVGQCSVVIDLLPLTDGFTVVQLFTWTEQLCF